MDKEKKIIYKENLLQLEEKILKLENIENIEYITILYLKICNHCDLKYFGKKEIHINDLSLFKKKLHKYKGSGRYWNRHLEKHKSKYKTKIINIFNDKVLCCKYAIWYSTYYDIVKSDKYANECIEDGLTGGCLGYKHTEEAKKKMRIEQKKRLENPENHPLFGKTHTEETKKKISIKASNRTGEKNGFYGKNHTEEVKQKISNGNKKYYETHDNPMKGKKHTEETKQKIRGRKHTEEAKQKMRDHLRTDEHKKKLSQSLIKYYKTHDNPMKGKKHNEETRQKIANANKKYHKTHDNPMKGRKHTEESKKKNSISQQNLPIIKCKYCYKEMKKSNINRWGHNTGLCLEPKTEEKKFEKKVLKIQNKTKKIKKGCIMKRNNNFAFSFYINDKRKQKTFKSLKNALIAQQIYIGSYKILELYS